MEIISEYHAEMAALFARVFLGLLFFFQGYDAVVKIGMRESVEAIRLPLSGKGIPDLMIVLGTWFNSYVELICGALLIFGLFQFASMYLLGITLLIASIGFGIHTALWDTKNVMPRLLLLIFLLAVPEHWHLFSIDTLLFR